MKEKIRHLTFLVLLFAACSAFSQSNTNPEKSVFGARLSICISNNIIASGSKAILNCISTNTSTNTVFFVEADPRFMYEIEITGDSGERFTLASPANAGDTSYGHAGISYRRSYRCAVPLVFSDAIKPGKYTMTAKQDVCIFHGVNRQGFERGELVSNPIEVQIK